MNWLSKFETVMLLAHNGQRFDNPRLLFHIKQNNYIDTFRKIVIGFADSLFVFRSKFPDFQNYKQETIYKNIIGGNYAAHDALEDVRALKKIVDKGGIKISDILPHSATTDSVHRQLEFSKMARKNKESLAGLVNSGVIKKYMANKIAGSGLSYEHLLLSYERAGDKGLMAVCKEKNRKNGEKARVTENKAILNKLCNHFSDVTKK